MLSGRRLDAAVGVGGSITTAVTVDAGPRASVICSQTAGGLKVTVEVEETSPALSRERSCGALIAGLVAEDSKGRVDGQRI